MEEPIARYLGVFLPFVATLICAHYVVRTNGFPVLGRADLGSTKLLWRALLATAAAAALIVIVDLLTDGELFLHPRSPGSQLLITLLLVGLLLAAAVGRSLAPIARWLRRAT